MTALGAASHFIPIATGPGSEIQAPMAIVILFGLVYIHCPEHGGGTGSALCGWASEDERMKGENSMNRMLMTAVATLALLVSSTMLWGHDERLHGANAVPGKLPLSVRTEWT